MCSQVTLTGMLTFFFPETPSQIFIGLIIDSLERLHLLVLQAVGKSDEMFDEEYQIFFASWQAL